jgi:hypothetical protein
MKLKVILWKRTPLFVSKAIRYCSHALKFSGIMILMTFFVFACSDDNNVERELSDLEIARAVFEELKQSPDNALVHFPAEDPGIPTYARMGPVLNQFLVAGDKLVIPFYRNPECIPANFNLLHYYDPPQAFGCELKVAGMFVIEKEAEAGQFPIMVHTSGTEVPFWIVDWSDLQAVMAGGSVTVGDLQAMQPMKVLASRFEEFLNPRMNEHQVVIEAEGVVQGSGQAFSFSLKHVGDQIEKISLEITP